MISSLYLVLFTILPFVVTQVYASSLRETGDSVKPMVAGVISVFVDILFNYLLIYGKFGFPRLGVRGAAIATLMACVVEMLIVVIWAHLKKHEHEFLQGLYRTLLVPRDLMGKMLKKGLPIFFNEFLWSGGILCIFLTVKLISISGVFPKFYDTSEQVRNYGQWFIIITALFFPVQGVLNALYFTLRSGGKTLVTFLFDSVYSLSVTLPIALCLCFLTDLPILGVYAIVQAADIAKVVIGYRMIKKGVWISNIVE